MTYRGTKVFLQVYDDESGLERHDEGMTVVSKYLGEWKSIRDERSNSPRVHGGLLY